MNLSPKSANQPQESDKREEQDRLTQLAKKETSPEPNSATSIDFTVHDFLPVFATCPFVEDDALNQSLRFAFEYTYAEECRLRAIPEGHAERTQKCYDQNPEYRYLRMCSYPIGQCFKCDTLFVNSVEHSVFKKQMDLAISIPYKDSKKAVDEESRNGKVEHSYQRSRQTDSRIKNRCYSYTETGHCKYGSRCRYIHDFTLQELSSMRIGQKESYHHSPVSDRLYDAPTPLPSPTDLRRRHFDFNRARNDEHDFQRPRRFDSSGYRQSFTNLNSYNPSNRSGQPRPNRNSPGFQRSNNRPDHYLSSNQFVQPRINLGGARSKHAGRNYRNNGSRMRDQDSDNFFYRR